MSSGIRIASALIAVFLWISALPVVSLAATGESEGTGSDIGYSEPEGKIPVPLGEDPEGPQIYSESQGGFVLNVDKACISLGESFQMKASFEQTVESNAAILICSYDSEEFEYLGFEAAEGVVVLSEEESEGRIKLICMISDYQLLDFGSFSMAVKSDQELYGRECAVSVAAEYVVLEGGGKITYNAFSEAEMLLVISGDVNRDGVIDLLDISDILDYFGIDAADENWGSIKWFDYNKNESVDIQDIAFIAESIIF